MRPRVVSDWLGYVLVPVAIWLGWEIVKTPVVERAPPALAIRLAPGSPEVLRRAAEVELQESRPDNAAALADESLRRAPFNARAMRVRGLAEARNGDLSTADEMLTLAGNWSLRDDPAHAWLVEYRLRRGDYHSAFGHADTLARRRDDLYPSLFRLFTTAVQQDSRAIPELLRLLGENPPWRAAYLRYLYDTPNSAPVLGMIAIGLQQTKTPFSNVELGRLYATWTGQRRFPGVQEIRTRLNRPSSTPALQNGAFDDMDTQILPFGWGLGIGAGVGAAVMEDDLREGNNALRVEYDGFNPGTFAQQLTMLPPGRYRLSGEYRAETSTNNLRMVWRVICADTNSQIAGSSEDLLSPVAEGWKQFQLGFEIPAENCSAQWIWVEGRPGDRRKFVSAWFDNLSIQPVR